MEFKISKNKVVVYKIRNTESSIGWTDITLDEGERSGRISIASDYGSWSYYWNACGESFKKFLCGVNISYVATKFREDNYFDLEGTLNKYKSDIIYYRRDEAISEEEARELWKEVESLSDNHHIEGFKVNMWNKSKLMDFYHSCPDIEEKIHPRFVRFWESPWKAFINQLQKEVDLLKPENN